MIDKINHFSIQNNPTVYDEEALTALELVARVTQKLNECIEEVNQIPEDIKKAYEKYLEDGTFDEQLEGYFDKFVELTSLFNQRLNALFEATQSHEITSATAAEVVDARTMKLDTVDLSMGNLGDSVRNALKKTWYRLHQHVYVAKNGKVYITPHGDNGGVCIRVEGKLTYMDKGASNTYDWYYMATVAPIDVGLMTDENGNKITDVDAPSALSTRGESGKKYPHIWISDDGNIAEIYTGQYRNMVVLWTGMPMLALRNSIDDIEYGDVPLIETAYGVACGGLLYDAYLRTLAEGAATKESLSTFRNTVQGYIYISNNAAVDITPDNATGGLFVTLGDKLHPLFYEAQPASEWSEVSSEIASHIVIHDDNSAVIHIPLYRQILVYNIGDDKLYIRGHIDDVLESDFVLVKNAWCNPSGGALVDLWVKQTAEKAAEDAANGGGSTAAVEVDFAKLEEHASHITSANDATFLFFTDPHLCEGDNWQAEFDKHMSVVKAYADAAAVDLVICGGDWLGNSDTDTEAMAKLAYVNQKMKSMFPNFINVCGNHDYNYQGSAHKDNGTHMDRAKIAKVLNYQLSDPRFIVNAAVGSDPTGFTNDFTNNLYFIVADTKTETVYYIYDTGTDWNLDGETDYHGEQHSFFLTQDSNNDGAYKSVWFMHRPYPDVIDSYADDIEQSVSFDYPIISGHTHIDSIVESYVPNITRRQLKDGNITCFDLVCVKAGSKMHFTRIGTGENYTYEGA